MFVLKMIQFLTIKLPNDLNGVLKISFFPRLYLAAAKTVLRAFIQF